MSSYKIEGKNQYASRNVPKREFKKGIPPKGDSLFAGNSKRGRGGNIPLGFPWERELLQEFLLGESEKKGTKIGNCQLSLEYWISMMH